MPSPADRGRLSFEWASRVIGLASLTALLWAMARHPDPAAPESFGGERIDEALVRWTLERPTDSVHLTLRAAPDAAQRDWLVALRAAGVGMAWHAPAIPALAIAAEPIAEPRRRSRIAVAAPRAAAVTVRDEVGVIDSVEVAGLGASLGAATVGRVEASVGPHLAAAPPGDSIVLKRVFVVGNASWESRFVLAALEEDGWEVDARMTVAPGVVVRQGPARPLDTARYSAVVALDGAAASDAAAIVRFVRSGGGVVLGGDAARVAALARIAPGGVGRRWQPTVRLATEPATRAALGYFPIQQLVPGAVTLEIAGGGIAAAAHRVGVGRVVQVGYDDTWRLRMTGGDEGPADHRAWWSGLVSAAAFAPPAPRASATLPTLGEDAPLASLVAAMGPPRSAAFEPPTSRSGRAWLEPALFALAIFSFLAEWTSRRLRGAS